MFLTFHQIEVSHFKSFRDRQVLNFDTFGDSGLIFVGGQNRVEPRLGANGTGKSSLWDSLTWCLYGRTVEGLRGPDIKPWEAKAKPEVTLILSVDDDEYTIRRTANPNTLTVNEAEATNEDIVKLMAGINLNIFSHTILLGQSMPLFFDLRNADKMRLLSDVLQIDRWEHRAKAAGSVTRDLEAKLTIRSAVANEMQRTIDDRDDQIKQVAAQSKEWSNVHIERLSENRAELEKCEKALQINKTEMKSLDAVADLAHTERRMHSENVAKAETEHDAANRSLSKAEAASKASGMQADRLERELAQIGDTCPVCGQSITGTDIEVHKQELRKQIGKLRSEQTAGPGKIAGTRAHKAKQALARAREQARGMERKAEEAEDRVDALRPPVARLTARVSALQETVREGESAVNPYREQLSDLKKRRTSAAKELAGVKKEIEDTERTAVQTKFWVKGFRDIRLTIITDVVQELELVSNSMLDNMGLVGWELQYDIERTTKSGSISRDLTVSILSPATAEPVRWESWSGGERQRLRLIGALALSDVLLNHAGIETSLDILDEPTQHLSSEGITDLCVHLASRAEQLGRQTWYTDHRSVESGALTNEITIVKSEKGSLISHG